MTRASQKPVVLVIAYLNSQVAQQLPLLQWLKNQGEYSPTLLFLQQEAIKGEFLDTLEQAGIGVIDRYGRLYRETRAPWSPLQPPMPETKPDQPSLFRRLVRRTPLPAILAASRLMADGLHYALTIRRLKSQAQRLLSRNRPALIILPEENVLSQTTVWSTTAKKNGIPVVIIPYTLANAVEFAESVHKATFLWVGGYWNRLIDRLFPHWVYAYKGKKLLLISWPRILVLQFMKLVPPDPWMLCSGPASAICMESDFMRQYFLDNGLPANQLVLTGSLHDDTLSRIQRERDQRLQAFRDLHGLDHRPLLLCALPPPWFPRPECEYHDFASMIHSWLEILTSQNKWQVVVHLHPRLRYDDLRYLESKFRIVILRHDITELIPLADLFVASISATIRWAIACGLPVLNYDVYRWGFHDFDSAKGVITVSNRRDFEAEYKRLSTEPSYWQSVILAQKTVSGRWGMLDGQSGQRLLELIQRLTTTSRP